MIDITLPGRNFAHAWTNTWLSTGTDEGRPALDHKILVEIFTEPRAVQLVATDSYTMLGSCVLAAGHEDDLPPDLSELPAERFLVADHDGRMVTLMKWLLKDCKEAAKEGDDEPTVHLTVKSGEAPSRPTLDESLDRQVLVVTTERERITLDIYEIDFPDWRRLLLGATPKPVEKVGLNAELLARVAKIKGQFVEPIVVRFSGPLGLARIEVATEPAVFGGLMPVRLGAERDSDDPADEDDTTVTLSITDVDGTTKDATTTLGGLERLAADLGGDAA